MLQMLEPELVTELAPTNYDEAKTEFLAKPELRTPRFEYGNAKEYSDKEVSLLFRLAAAFEEFGLKKTEMKILYDYVNSIKNKIGLLKFVLEYRMGMKFKTEAIRNQSYWLYDSADSVTYRALLGREIDLLQKRELGKRDALALEEVMKNHSAIRPAKADLFTPKDATVKAFGELCRKKWKFPLSRIIYPKTKAYTAEEVAELLREIIREDLPEARSFQVVVSETKKSLSVNQQKHLIELPRHRAAGPYTADVIEKKIVGHELMTHVMRTAWADANYPEVAVPLAGYAEFEEGVARAVEQGLEGVYYPAGAWHYIAIGMAEHDRADFREVYQVQRTLRFLKMVEKDDPEDVREQKMQKASNQAFQCTTRCFRGTGEVPLTKDLMYFHGQQRVWRLIEKYVFGQPEELWQSLFESGKTDISNGHHRMLLESLGLQRVD